MGWVSAWAASVITMWPEPLTPATAPLTRYAALHTVRAGDGTLVARVRTAYNAGAGTGMFGEMIITDPAGGPKQRVRALALLVREALRYGAEIGIRDAWTDVPADRPALLDFARRLAGRAGAWLSVDAVRIGGQLHEMRTATLRETDADGNLTGGDIADL